MEQGSDSSTSLKALLENLRSSKAWADVTATQQASVAQPPAAAEQSGPAPRVAPPIDDGPSPAVSSKISSLLALLGPGSSLPPLAPTQPSDAPDQPMPEAESSAPIDPSPQEPPSAPAPVDVRYLSFQKSLGHISLLLEDPAIIRKLEKIKEEQDATEQTLWKGRQDVVAKHEQNIRAARNTARIITGSTNLSVHETRRLNGELEKSLLEYDQQHVLPGWDSLVKKQRTMLEELRVPGMYATSLPDDRKRQQRIVGVIEDGLG